MSEVSFEVKQETLALIQNTDIEANFDECKAALTEMVEPYKTLIVTADGIAAAKADRAKLNKVTARIDDMRKTVKKAYNEPLAKFEAKCKELVAIVADGSANLDKQITAFEDAEKKEKLEALHSEYVALTDEELEMYCPWGCINNPKWQNKGYSFDSAVEEIKAALENTRNDLETIRGMGGADTMYLLDIYRQTRDLSAVVRKASELKTMRQREAQREREEAEHHAEMAATDIDSPTLLNFTFRVKCTKAQLAALGKYMQENGIWYGRA